jgi:hypothetical protein
MPARFISTAVRILRESPDSSDEEIFVALVRAGIERKDAARLVEFLPIAYCRLLLGSSGVCFSDTFQRRTPGGDTSAELPLTSESIWVEISDFAKAEVHHGVPRDEWLALAGRSAEFAVINQLLNQGAKLTNVALTPVLLSWPENGPPL